MDHDHRQQPSLAVALSDSLRDGFSSFLQTLEASSDSSNMTKAMTTWAGSSESATTRRLDDLELSNDEILALTLEAEELAAVKASPQETTSSASQHSGAKSDKAHKHSCTVDGTCSRDLWLRGIITVACASIILLS